MHPPTVTDSTPAVPHNDLRMILVVARRAALESLRDRSTAISGIVFGLVVPTLFTVVILRPLAADPKQAGGLGSVMATFLFIIGLLNTSASIGIAAGQFAGEKEQGSLTPLLASPLSNIAIFGGKVLGSILPAMAFAAIAEGAYLLSITVLLGVDKLARFPVAFSLSLLALVPAFALLSAAIASLISSRVRTYNAAQNIGGFVMLPLWFFIFAVAGAMQRWGLWAMLGSIALLILLNIVLLLIGASTWRREEVLAKQ